MTQPEFQIVEAAEADSGELWTLQRGAFVDEAHDLGHTRIPPLTETLDEVRAAIRDHLVLNVKHRTRIVGTARLLLKGDAWIERVAVAPDLRRFGIGRNLIAELVARVPQTSGSVNLHAAETQAGAKAFYESMGFEPVERVEESPGVFVIHYRKVLTN